MAKSTTNQIDRSRPSNRVQPQGLLDSTPVLFRLPTVQVHPLPSVADGSTVALQQAKPDTAEPAVSEPSAPPVSVVSQPTVAVQEKSSWWEHWSSGIVLIVLLVAMYVTSIVVLKNRSQKPTSTLAEEKTEFGDLANIQVPEIQCVAETPSLSTAVVQESSEAALTTVQEADTNASADELVGSISNSLTLTSEPAAAPTIPPIAHAQLLEPTQLPQMLPLLNNSTLGDNNSLSVQPVSSASGQSPNLYDGARNQLEANSQPSLASSEKLTPTQAQIALPSLPGATGTGSPVSSADSLISMQSTGSTSGQTSLTQNNTIPGYPTNALQAANNGSSIPNIVPGTVLQTPTMSTVSTGTTAMRQTATPEANGDVEAIIRAYIEKKRADAAAQQQLNMPANSLTPTR